MTSRSPIERQTPAAELEKFRSFCEERPGSIHEAANQAVLEFLPVSFVPDGYRSGGHEVEEQLIDDLDHAGLVGDSSRKDSGLDESQRTRLNEQDTEKCRIHIDDPLLEALEKYVISEEGKKRGEVGVYFALALSEYRDGGQLGRIREWYARLRDNMDFLPEDRKTRTETIVSRLQEQLAERERELLGAAEVNDLIQEVTDAEVDSAVGEYRRRVLDELGFVEVSTHEDLYAPPEVAEELEADRAMDDLSQSQYDAMDREGRVEHLRTALRQRAEVSDGADGLTYTDVIEKVFEDIDGPSHNYAYSLMDEAAEASGFRYGEYRGQKRLRFNEQWVGANNETEASSPSKESTDDAVSAADATIKEGWVERATDRLGDAPADITDIPLNNAIAKAKHPDCVEENHPDHGNPHETIDDDLVEAVTEAERERVREELADDSDPDAEPVTATVPREETEATMDALGDAVEAEPEKVVTDGGLEETPADEVSERMSELKAGHPAEGGPAE